MDAPRAPSNSELSPRPSSHRAVGFAIVCLIGLGLLAFVALWRTGRWLGSRELVSQTRSSQLIPVLSGSMAPTLHGPAWKMFCEECEFRFLADAAPTSGDNGRASESCCCPNCGNQSEVTRLASSPTEQRVRLLPIAAASKIERGTIVAASESGTDRFMVKRVMGLPGETIAICNGDIYANGRLCRKILQTRSPSNTRVSAILVHDDAHRSVSGSRWQIKKENTSEGTTWLEYCHSPALPRPFRRGQLSPIRDNYGFNQNLSRSLHDVRDVWVEFKWKKAPTDSLYLEHRNASHVIRCSLAAKGAWVLEIDGKERAVLPSDVSAGECRVLWGVVDGQIELAVNDMVVVREPIDDDLLPAEVSEFVGNERPFAIGFQREQISDLRIWRDVYYTQPNDATENSIWTSRQLEQDEYLLLGDNSPISEDARQSEAGYVKREQIVGVVEALRIYGWQSSTE